MSKIMRQDLKIANKTISIKTTDKFVACIFVSY